MQRLHTLYFLTLLAALLSACSGNERSSLEQQPASPAVQDAQWPAALPQDALQPWEERSGSALDAASEFISGGERFLESGNVIDAGIASRIGDNSSSGNGLSHAMYRIPLPGAQPGALAIDANALEHADGGSSEYYIGLSNYGLGRWEWQGPFSDHHVRLVHGETATPGIFTGDDYTSSVENLFVTVLVADGGSVDLLGITADILSVADAQAPDAPAGLAATPVPGGLLLEWDSVSAPDLAGYRIHYSGFSFSSITSANVRHMGYVEGSTRHLLSGLSGETFVRITAVDNNGNESAASGIISAVPLAGQAPALTVGISSNDVPRNAAVQLSVSGETEGLLFDYDLDGDGVFEILADSAASKALPTQDTGIIRAAVLASDGSEQRMALGGVSLLVTSNSRPVAYGVADVQSGQAPLDVAFDGSGSTDFDGTITGGGWDFDGDGIFDVYSEENTSNLTANHQYTSPGFYNARLRVIDDEGAWDVDTVGIFVDGGASQNLAPVASLTLSPAFVILGISDSPIEIILDASDSFDPESGVLEYAWDVDGNGSYAAFGPDNTATYGSFTQGLQRAGVRVRDEAGNISQATITYPVYQFNSHLIRQGAEIANETAITSIDSNSGSTRIGIAYYDFADDFLRFTYSTDQNGYSWTQPYIVDGLGGEWMDLVPDTTRFRLVWYRDGDLFYAESDDDGLSFDPPQNVDIGPDDSGLYVSSDKSPGALGLSFAYYNATDGDLYYTTQASGGGFEAPVNVDGTGNTGLYPDLLYDGGRMNIAYYREDTGNLMFARSSDSNGLSWNVPVIADDSVDDVGEHPSLIKLGTSFAIAYIGVGNDVWFVTSTSSDGLSWNEPLYLGNVTARTCELMIVNDRPTIFIGDDFFGRGEFIMAQDFNGTEWGSWEYYDYGDTTAFMSATKLPNGQPALAYWDEDEELYFSTPRFD